MEHHPQNQPTQPHYPQNLYGSQPNAQAPYPPQPPQSSPPKSFPWVYLLIAAVVVIGLVVGYQKFIQPQGSAAANSLGTATTQSANTVTQTPATHYTANFAQGVADWQGASAWHTQNGILYDACAATCNLIAPINLATPNYVIHARIRIISGNGGFFGLICRVHSDGYNVSGYIAGFAGVTPKGSAFSGIDNISFIGGGPKVASLGATIDNQFHDYTFALRGNQLTFSIDGFPTLQGTDASFSQPGGVGLRAASDARIAVSEFSVTGL